MYYNDANKVVDEYLESLSSRYQGKLETTMRGNDFIYIFCYCHKINFKRAGSYIDSPDWIKFEKYS